MLGVLVSWSVSCGRHSSQQQTTALIKAAVQRSIRSTRNDAGPLASQAVFPGCDTRESSSFEPRRPKFHTHCGLSAAHVELSPAFCRKSRGAGYGPHNQRRRCRACRWSRASPSSIDCYEMNKSFHAEINPPPFLRVVVLALSLVSRRSSSVQFLCSIRSVSAT